MRKQKSVRPNQWVSQTESRKKDIESILLETEAYKVIPKDKNQSNSLEPQFNLDIAEQKHLEKILLTHPLDHKKFSNANCFYFFTVEVQFDLLGRPSDYRLLENNLVGLEHAGISLVDGNTVNCVFPELESSWLEVCGRVALTGNTLLITKEFSTFNRWYSIHVFRIGGDNSKKVATIIYDITNRKRDENLLAFEANLLSSLHDAIIATDENLMITYWNTMTEELFGWSSQEAVGESLLEVLRTAGHYSLKKDMLSETSGRIGEVSCYHKDGHIIHTEFHFRPLIEQGEQKGNIISFRDITRQKIEEMELKEVKDRALALVEQLLQGDQEKTEFIHIISHELRNPLASLMISLSLLDRVHTQNPEQIQTAIESMKRQTSQLTRLVDDLLDITRISRSNVKLKKEIIELNELACKSIDDFKSLFEKKGIRLELTTTPFPIYLEADAARLNQIIGNLLHNSAKFTTRGEKVMVAVQRDDDTWEAVISVKDQGVGMEKEEIGKLFEPFTQVNKSLDRIHGGLGLGLSIVKGMVKLHGGNVTAFSDGIGKGMEFIVRLPIKMEIETNLEEQPQSRREPTPSMRILVIDDVKDIAEILATLLRNLGHSVITASNGEKGIAMAKEFQPDVVLCDIGLPGMDGYKVAKRFRNDNKLKDIILIALTGYAHPDYLKLTKEAGFNRHLAKPVDLTTLEQTLAEVLE